MSVASPTQPSYINMRDDYTISSQMTPPSPDCVKDIHRQQSDVPPTRKVNFTGLPGDPFAAVDKNAPRKDLILKLESLTEKLKSAEEDVYVERSARYKKDRNLRKLAKELNKRFARAAEEAQRLNKLEQELNQTEKELALARSKLEQQESLYKRALNDHRAELEAALADAHATHKTTCAEHDARITELCKSHSEQCHRICQELAQAYQETDQLRSERSLDSVRGYDAIVSTNFAAMWDMVTNTLSDISSPTRKNGSGVPVGLIFRQLFA